MLKRVLPNCYNFLPGLFRQVEPAYVFQPPDIQWKAVLWFTPHLKSAIHIRKCSVQGLDVHMFTFLLPYIWLSQPVIHPFDIAAVSEKLTAFF